jgi:hypothetical protein
MADATMKVLATEGQTRVVSMLLLVDVDKAGSRCIGISIRYANDASVLCFFYNR